MAQGTGRQKLGRLITILGVLWIAWSLVIGARMPQLAGGAANLPVLPGIALLFLGRLLGRVPSPARGGGDDQAPEVEALSAPRLPETRSVPEPPPPPGVTIGGAPEPEAEPMSAAMADALEGMEQEIAARIADAGARKTSAEMVAEARERFGRRP